jgi:hypothetical protein
MFHRLRLTLLASTLVTTTTALSWNKPLPLDEPAFVPYSAWVAPDPREDSLLRSGSGLLDKRLLKEVILQADDFVLAMGAGSAMAGVDVLQIDGQGHVSYKFSTDRNQRWNTYFTISKSEIEAMRQMLVDADFPSLEGYYIAANIVDGTQWYIRVEAGRVTQKVSCSNYFPIAVARIARAISEEVLATHESAIKKAWRIPQSDARWAAAKLSR